MDNKQKFISLTKQIQRPGIERLMGWLENNTDFFTAPASTRFHGAEPGGLCAHSLAVAKWMCILAHPIALVTGKKFSKESLLIVSLFHDLCKCNCYKAGTRNVKDETTGRWEKVPCYTWEEQQCFGGHGAKSMYLAQFFLKLSFEEAAAINSHMGFSDANINSVSSCYDQNTLAWLLHIADEAATYIDKM